MRAITGIFLRAKHWQIFLLLIGLFLVGNVALIIWQVSSVRSSEDFSKADIPFVVVWVVFASCYLIWFWSMGSFLGSVMQPALRLKLVFFRFALLYPVVYGLVFFALFGITKPAVIAVIFPLHLLAMFCMFYDLYFVSKSLVLTERGRPVSFCDYARPFFLLWFFPIGIWIVQPRINRLYAERRNNRELAGDAVTGEA